MRFLAVALGVLLLLAWDTYLYVARGPDATLSTLFRQWVADYPIVSFLLGMLLGHVLWPLR